MAEVEGASLGSVCPHVCCLLLSADLSDRMIELEGREKWEPVFEDLTDVGLKKKDVLEK